MRGAWKQWEGLVVNGKFPLRQYLGGTEHSAVFLTECAQRGARRAAIKLIPADLATTEVQLSQWKQAAKLSHPHLIQLFEMGGCRLNDMDLAFVVMEYAEENLAQVLPNRPLTPAETHAVLVPALDALACLHGQNFVHGHLKPANILAVKEELKLSSDRLCRIGEAGDTLAAPSVYDPPERASGKLSPASDLWSLAMTLVEALTQHLPTRDGTGRGPVLPENLPSPFKEIARHCLFPEPQRRWTVAEIAGLLNQTAPTPDGRTITGTGQTKSGSLQALAGRRFIIPAAAVVVAIAAILVGPRLLHRSSQAGRNDSIALQQQSQPKPAPTGPSAGKNESRETPRAEQQASGGTSPQTAPRQSAEGARTQLHGGSQDEVVHRVIPDVSPRARETIQGTVRVRVRVRGDASGRVVGAEFDSPGPSKYFAGLAMQAARGWKFAPAGNQQDDLREWILRFEFRRNGTRVHAARVSR